MEVATSSKRTDLVTSLVTQNMTLKTCLMASTIVVLILLVGLIALAFKEPLVVGLEENGPKVLSISREADELDGPSVRAFIFDLLGRKFTRRPTIENQLLVCDYFTDGPRAACDKNVRGQKSFIPQDFIIQELTWNSKNEVASLALKRFANFSGSITSVEGIVKLKLTKRSRTNQNPWGIYVESWKEDLKQ